jgi:hypothetical protein
MGTLPPRFSSTNTRPSINGHDPARSTGCRPADLPNGCHPTGGITWRGHERYKYQGVQQKISTGGNLFDHRLAVPRNQKQDSKYWEHPGIQTVDEVDGNDLINYRAAAWQRQFKAKHKVQSIERAAAWQKQGQFTSKTQSTSNERRITNNFPKGHTSNIKTHLRHDMITSPQLCVPETPFILYLRHDRTPQILPPIPLLHQTNLFLKPRLHTLLLYIAHMRTQ